MGSQMLIFLYSLLTAIATGLWAVPFVFRKKFSFRFVAIGTAIAGSLMVVASFGMIEQWISYGIWWVFFGILGGLLFIILSANFLDRYEDLKFSGLKGVNAKKVLLMVGVMFVHSFCEGVAMGVSFWPSMSFGIFVSLIIAIQNIPEWLAISLTMVPKWVSRRKASLRSIFTSLPQALMALPAFWIVTHFPLALPLWLGFAAGAMIWMAFSELFPEATKHLSPSFMATIVTISIALMILVESFLS